MCKIEVINDKNRKIEVVTLGCRRVTLSTAKYDIKLNEIINIYITIKSGLIHNLIRNNVLIPY